MLKKELAVVLFDYIDGHDGESVLQLNDDVKKIVKESITEDIKEKDAEKIERFDITDEYYNEGQAFSTFIRDYDKDIEEFVNETNERKAALFIEFLNNRIEMILDLEELSEEELQELKDNYSRF